MTTTPRTDAEEMGRDEGGYCIVVDADFARTLETELAASRAECERLREALVNVGTSPTVGPLAAAEMANIANRALRGGA